MKKMGVYVVIIFLSLFNSSTSYSNIEGIWHGKLVLGPESELAVHFLIKSSDDGSYSAMLNSPSSDAINNLPADKISFVDNILKIDFSELSGSFEGILKKGALEGNWHQPGESIPLKLKPFEDKPLSKNIIAKIEGRWQGELKLPSQSYTIVMIFEVGESGKLRGKFQTPDQSSGSALMNDLIVSMSDMSFSMKVMRATYKGKFVDGNIIGEWKQNRAFPLTMSRAKFDQSKYALKFSGKTRTLLTGDWHGQIERPESSTTIALRFVQSDEGHDLGYLDYPDYGTVDIRLKEVTLNGSDITISAGAALIFSGKNSGDQIIGEIIQRDQKYPLTIRKGKLPPLILDIQESKHEILEGEWTGNLLLPEGKLRTTLNFEKTDDGGLVGFIDSPDQALNRVRITSATFDDSKLTLNSSALKLVYSAELLNNDEMKGQVDQKGQTMDLTVKKQK